MPVPIVRCNGVLAGQWRQRTSPLAVLVPLGRNFNKLVLNLDKVVLLQRLEYRLTLVG